MVPGAPSVARLIRTATATGQNVAHELGRSEFLHSLDPLQSLTCGNESHYRTQLRCNLGWSAAGARYINADPFVTIVLIVECHCCVGLHLRGVEAPVPGSVVYPRRLNSTCDTSAHRGALAREPEV